MIVRHARRDDLHALSALAVETFGESFGHSFSEPDLVMILARNLSPDCFSRYLEVDVVLLAEEDRRLIGLVQFGPVKTLPVEAIDRDRELRRLYVLADHRNRGVGRSLMAAALEHPELSGAANIYLDVWEHNVGARRFYQSYGFEAIGRHRLEVGSGAETDFDLIMVRRHIQAV